LRWLPRSDFGMESVAFWSTYENLAARLLNPLTPGDGVPEAEVEAAEARLGCRLPALLREHYRLTGAHPGINGAQEFLVEPSALRRRGHKVVFLVENQGLLEWAVDLREAELADPPVYCLVEGGDWTVFSEHLSEFLYGMLLWQCAHGAMENHGIGVAPRARLERLTEGWESLVFFGDSIALLRKDMLLVYSARDTGEKCQVFVGARTWEGIEALAEEFRIDWGYLTADPDDAHDPDVLSLNELSAIMARQAERSRTPWGETLCAGCGGRKRTWADTARGVCSRCGHPLGPPPLNTAAP